MTSSVVLITFRHFNCVGESAAGRNDYIHGGEKNKKNKKVKRCTYEGARQTEYNNIALRHLNTLTPPPPQTWTRHPICCWNSATYINEIVIERSTGLQLLVYLILFMHFTLYRVLDYGY